MTRNVNCKEKQLIKIRIDQKPWSLCALKSSLHPGNDTVQESSEILSLEVTWYSSYAESTTTAYGIIHTGMEAFSLDIFWKSEAWVNSGDKLHALPSHSHGLGMSWTILRSLNLLAKVEYLIVEKSLVPWKNVGRLETSLCKVESFKHPRNIRILLLK